MLMPQSIIKRRVTCRINPVNFNTKLKKIAQDSNAVHTGSYMQSRSSAIVVDRRVQTAGDKSPHLEQVTFVRSRKECYHRAKT